MFPLAGGAARQTMVEYRATLAKISAKYGNDKYGEALYKEMEDGVNQRYEEENSQEWQDWNSEINPNPKPPMTEQERRDKILDIFHQLKLELELNGKFFSPMDKFTE